MKVCIISKDATYGNVACLAKGISTFHETKLILGHKDKKEMFKQFPASFGYNIPKADKYIVVGAITLDETGVVPDIAILTDTRYVKDHKRINKLLTGKKVFAMPDLIKYREGLPTEVYYQPFDIDIPIIKNQELTVCHSPFHKSKFRTKGTRLITDIVTSYPVRYSYLTGLTWVNSITEKSRAHIFIDQVGEDAKGESNGIGKSGLEAMLLDCMVISSGKLDSPDIPPPPAVMVTPKTLEEILKYYIYNAGAREEIALKQKEWALKYLNKEFWAKRLLA